MRFWQPAISAKMHTASANDPRVAPGQAAKMTARLLAATASGEPVLLRVDYDAGHRLGSTKTQRDVELAEEYSFLLWQFGIRNLSPREPPPRAVTSDCSGCFAKQLVEKVAS